MMPWRLYHGFLFGGVGIRVEGVGFRVQGLRKGITAQASLRFRAQGSGVGVGFGVTGWSGSFGADIFYSHSC